MYHHQHLLLRAPQAPREARFAEQRARCPRSNGYVARRPAPPQHRQHQRQREQQQHGSSREFDGAGELQRCTRHSAASTASVAEEDCAGRHLAPRVGPHRPRRSLPLPRQHHRRSDLIRARRLRCGLPRKPPRSRRRCRREDGARCRKSARGGAVSEGVPASPAALDALRRRVPHVWDLRKPRTVQDVLRHEALQVLAPRRDQGGARRGRHHDGALTRPRRDARTHYGVAARRAQPHRCRPEGA